MARTADDDLLRELNAPDPAESMEALGYWITRRRGLPFYKRSARREAEQMISFWQGKTVRDVTRAPLAALASRDLVTVAGLVAGYQAQRAVGRLTRFGVLCCVVIATVLVLGPRLI